MERQPQVEIDTIFCEIVGQNLEQTVFASEFY